MNNWIANPAVAVALPAVEWNGAERSEGPKSGAAGNATTGTGNVTRLDPELAVKPKRRIFTADYKQRILEEVDGVRGEPGAIGALLRREGLYRSHLKTWRHARAAGILHVLVPPERDPKSKKDPLDEENAKLRRENQRLTEELRKAKIILELQEKLASLFGRSIASLEPGERP